ncbi:chaperone modulator CbpM [Noviherbaspirillum sp.]|uniref:chaperone modulator CbpM n=1 Tax=Noviherbaspirillum sp. TaxID=1926288 RepID=UPI002B4A27BE|nr:chaperone modulator CbpM [Noviherbaspirillum sp.]HJV80703.1 chaperone modulator CbpM [Noviherbaspirillum sp.]
MAQELIGLLMEDVRLSVDELAASCTVSREWIVEHVQAGVLAVQNEQDPSRWSFTGQDLLRTRRLYELERNFDANPELAGLVADLFDELERLRARLRGAGLPMD